jgi:Protein of unknown function (DUF1553)/Protein of unknown function (DUF1549)/Planctomycete cytochrome C
MSSPPLLRSLTGAAGVALLALTALGSGGLRPEAAPEVRYSRDIRPLLSDRCFTCHGPEDASRKSGLRLDRFDTATADLGGYAAIVPGDAEGSELWRRVTSSDAEVRMPPPAAHRAAFTDDELAQLRAWIEAGAGYEEHWSFVTPTRPELPASRSSDHPIDAFVRARLDDEGVQPSPEERPDLLLRRLFFDLLGLPPTIAELDSFLADYTAADADRDAIWLAWVDRLLTEEPYRSRYAERMTAPWLDQARYADTNGLHMDAGRQIWPWRDWVLRAYRDNMPFDRFLTEQLAGDLLEDATLDQRIASGFNRNHVITDEGGAIDDEYLVEYAVDRVDTTAQVFLGLTMACARCHDHKFDPISQADYYRFFAFFNSNEEPGLYSQLPDPERAFEPFLALPSPEQEAMRAELETALETLRAELTAPTDADLVTLDAWKSELPAQYGIAFADHELVDARSTGGSQFEVLEDGSLLATGEPPETDVHRFTLRTAARDLRLLQVDALTHESLAAEAPGRTAGGNAVLTSIAIEAISVVDPTQRRAVELVWAWADYGQADSDDWGVLRAFDPRHNTGWALGGHFDGSERSAWFMAAEPFGFEGGTEVVVTLGYESIWAGHAFGRTGLRLASLNEDGVEALPVAQTRWFECGPFDVASAALAYESDFGPESDTLLSPKTDFPAPEGGVQRWTYRAGFEDGTVQALTSGVNVTYLGKQIWSPTARDVEVSIGSDDGFAIYLNGEQVAAREVPRGVAADQDRVALSLNAGRNSLVFKVINTGGASGFYFEALEDDRALAGALPGALIDASSRADSQPDYVPREGAVIRPLPELILHAWRLGHSEVYAAALEREAELIAAQAANEAAIPLTMVMRELEEPRPAFVLERGEYDKPDAERPVEPGVPVLFASYSEAPAERATRLDLARWLTSPDHPLVSRVAVNRFWQLLFGRGLVPTSGDFGYQGAWPSHPELLDWLAVDFVESGWDVQALLRTIVTSATYRQSSTQRPELREVDPEGALLASYPRRRLDAEAIRDAALYTAGLLVEDFGGPSVKPYQPPGLWQEISMLGSNTRQYERGMGDELWRRSLYTYWKRASPPPAMLTFDAPTRESCVIQRSETNTPLQALVLWNDVQFVEAARELAERCLLEGADRPQTLRRMFRRCTGREPTAREAQVLEESLDAFHARYVAAPDEAAALLAGGEAPVDPSLDATELAAWTVLANVVLNLHATLTQG